ncbi:hypothetical protein PG999_010169 [Apiospora kogelbergensis]|uniref:FAD-dependent urate hydroxylase HpyO/Asp monooxygenase CreE-like FAD/NAD(P)-binding domain-containing protein n=1 Tax=Apiospora kogelbergensis TaxID=1337665 RepID=A0AAW0Q9B0_9PEZI
MTVSQFSSTRTTPGSYHAHIAIVGAGPRGTSVLERLAAYAPDLVSPGKDLTVHVIDPSPPGAGNVWRTTQSSELLMNTVTSQITLFTDKSVESARRICPGPTLYEWLADKYPQYGPDDYPTRAIYGEYLQWVFDDVVARAPPNFHVEVHATRAVRLDDGLKGFQTLALDNGTTLTGLAAVVLAQGHLPLVADPEQQALTAYAQQHPGLTYIAPVNPADVDLSPLGAGEPVFLRGLGLCFFDYMALLTLGRGGRFERTDQGLRYMASGAEPRMYASSRRGIPYQARGDNEKGAYGRHYSILMTDEVIAGFRRRANAGDDNAPDFMKEVWPLIRKEVELIYYEALLQRTDFRARFLEVPSESIEEYQLLEEVGVTPSQIWSWDLLGRPHAGRKFTDAAEWQDWIVEYLREDVRHASLGNVSGPLKAALDLLRDLRNEVRLIVDHAGLSGASRKDHVDRWYTPLNGYLSIGPPRERIEQMIALLEAGVLTLVGPSPEVVPREDGHGWTAQSPEVPGSAVHVTALVEARLPEPDLRQTGDALLARLQETGQCRPHMSGEGYETGGLDVTQSPFHLIDCQGRAHPRRFALGVPTEGAHWVTAAGARPGVNSVTLCDTDAVAGAALVTAAGGMRALSPQFRPMVQSEAMMMTPVCL